MVSYITAKASQYYTKASSTVKEFVGTHPNLIKTAVLAAVTIGAYTADYYGRQAAFRPNGDISCVFEEPECTWDTEYRECDMKTQNCFIYEMGDKWETSKYSENNGTIVERHRTLVDCYYSEPECNSPPSVLEDFVSGLKNSVSKMTPLLADAAIGVVGLGKLTQKSMSKFSEYVFTPQENSSAWAKAAKGFAYYPFVKLAGHASVLAACVAGRVEPKAVKDLLSQSIPVEYLLQLGQMFNMVIPTEEFMFRTVFQDLIMKKGISAVLGTCSAALAEKNLNHPAAKITRVALSSILFSLYHLVNLGIMTADQVNYQMANTFGAGLVLGYLQEITGDTWASVGAHLAMNNLSLASMLQNPTQSG